MRCWHMQAVLRSCSPPTRSPTCPKFGRSYWSLLRKNKLLSLSCNSLCQELKNCGMSEWVVACLLHLCLISSFDILSCNAFNSGEGHMRVDYFAFSWRSWCHKLFTNCWSFRLQVKASRGARDVTFIEMPKLWNFSQALVEGGGEKWGKKPPEVTGTT